MKQKTVAFLIYIFVFTTAIYGQEKYVEKAMKLVKKGNIDKAKGYLDRTDLENSEAYISDYYLVKGYIYDAEDKIDSAMLCYEKVLDARKLDQVPNKVIVDYAAYLFNSGRYDETTAFIGNANQNLEDTKYPLVLDRINDKAFWAIQNLDGFSSSLGSDSIVDVSLGSNKLVIDVPRFGAAFYNDSLVFASYTNFDRPTRVEEEADEYNQILQDYQRTNTDLYIASLDDEFDNRKLFAEDIASLENEGALTFNKDYTKMYYTRNVYKKGREMYMIYHAEKMGNEWINKGPVNFNSEGFNSMQPAFAPDGKGIYFVSNNPGGYGGYDIYYAEGDGTTFKKPQNLGEKVNSIDNEIFPYMQNDTIMMYSSNGQLGFGGYDIYWVDIKSEDRTPHNLLQPINSNSDDYCIVGNRNNPEQMLFFSDRDLSMGNLAMGTSGSSQGAEALSFKISLLPPGKELSQDEMQQYASDNSLLKDKVKDSEKTFHTADNADADIVVLLDESGKPVLDASGYPVILPEGTYQLSDDGQKILDDNGNVMQSVDGKTLNLAEANLALNDDGTLSTGKPADFFSSTIHIAELEASNVILPDVNGNPVFDVNGNPIILSDNGYGLKELPDDEGQILVDEKGFPILGADGKPIILPNEAVALNEDGELMTIPAGDFFGSAVNLADMNAGDVIIPDKNGNPIFDANGNPVILSDNKTYTLKDGVVEGGQILVDENGYPVLGANGKPVIVPDGSLAVNEDGEVITAPASDFFGTAINLADLGAGDLVLLDANGRPVRDASGNPIILSEGTYSIAEDGTTLLDANGYPILDENGNSVQLPTGIAALNDDETIVTADASDYFGRDVQTGVGSDFASLYFDLNSSTLSDEAKQNLTMVAEYLKAKTAMKLVISGNAGLRGNESYNLVISTYRAYQAYEFMTSTLGLSDESILLEASGKYFPKVNTYDVNKGLENRRVDIKAQWAEPNKGLKVRFKITDRPQERLITNLIDLYLEQHPEADYLCRVKEGNGIYRVAKNHDTSIDALKQLNNMGTRNYLIDKEVILVKPHDVAVKDMVLDVMVKTLYYVPKDTDMQSIADKFKVSVETLLRVNKLKNGETVKAQSKLIIPIN